MAQYAGQMLNAGNVNATGPLWVTANGANFDRFTGGKGGGYFQRIGWRSGMVGIGRFKIPYSLGWVVLLDDNPSGATLPPDTPTAANPPTAPPPIITVNAITSPQAVGNVPVTGIRNPNVPAQAAPVYAGVPGTFAAVAGTTSWSASVPFAASTTAQVRARITSQSYIYADSNTFTVA